MLAAWAAGGPASAPAVPDIAMLNAMEQAGTLDALKAEFERAWTSTKSPSLRTAYKAKYDARQAALTPATATPAAPAEGDI